MGVLPNVGSRWLVACAVFATGCLQSNLLPCGDSVCAIGDVCTPGGCTLPGDVAACAGLTEGAKCNASDGAGTCSEGGCRGGLVWTANVVIGAHAIAAATSANIYPSAVAVGPDGSVYVADQSNNRVWKIDTSATITSVAGTGTPGYSGDNAVATAAQLNYPSGVAVDGLGNLYIADTQNARVRRVTNNIITTVAGTGAVGFSGKGGAPTSASFGPPQAVAVDGSGDLYIADATNHCVWEVDAAMTTITTLATTTAAGSGSGSGSALLLPVGVAVDANRNVYVADSQANVVWEISSANVVTEFAGTYGVAGDAGDGGTAITAQLSYPVAVSVDQAGNVFVVDYHNNAIRKIVTTGMISTYANGIGNAQGVAVDRNDNLYIAETGNRIVRRLETNGNMVTIGGDGLTSSFREGGAATSRDSAVSGAVAVDVHGNLYVGGNGRVSRVAANGAVATLAGNGSCGSSGDDGPAIDALVCAPGGLALDAAGDVYFSDYNAVREITAAGNISTVAGSATTAGYGGDSGPATSALLDHPAGVAVDSSGNLFVADAYNNRVREVDTAGTITSVSGTYGGAPYDIEIYGGGGYGGGGDGGCGYGGCQSTPPSTTYVQAVLTEPLGVAVKANDQLVMAYYGNSSVYSVNPAGTLADVAGTGTAGYAGDGSTATNAQLASPSSVALDGQGNLYVLDPGDNCIREISPAGIVTTFAGSPGQPGFAGDGGSASSAVFDFYAGQPVIAVDGTGNVYVDDYGYVREIGTSGKIHTVAGPIDPAGMGPLALANLADPRAFVVAAPFTLFAGGTTGTVQAAVAATSWLQVAAGRYPQSTATGVLARFRDSNFGDVDGIAYDAIAGVVYVSETTANRIDAVTIVDPDDDTTWTIASLANTAGTAGYQDGAVATAQFNAPTGLAFDAVAHKLYVADTGNEVVRVIDLPSGMVTTIAGTPSTQGFGGDAGSATAALLYNPSAVAVCGSDVFIADTGNNRVRRVSGGTISTVLGTLDGAASAGEGSPSSMYPVNAPLGLACDATGNLYITSTDAVRMVLANSAGVVDGTGTVQTIYGLDDSTYPQNATQCLSGLAVTGTLVVQVVDSCAGMLVQIDRAKLP